MKLHHMLIVLKINQQNAYYQKKNIKRNKIKLEIIEDENGKYIGYSIEKTKVYKIIF